MDRRDASLPILRPATPADRPAAVELLAACGLPTSDLDLTACHLLLAEDDGRLVGAAGMEVHGTAALFRSLAVAPTWRGRGLGHRLFEALLREARARRVAEAFALTTSIAELAVSWGFAVVPRERVPEAIRNTPQFAGLCPASATCLRLTVGAETD